MNQEISKIIEMIDKKIKSLSQARQILIDEFGIGKMEGSLPLPLMSSKTLIGEQVTTTRKLTRKNIVVNLLKEQGALSRKDILEKTGLPKGTIAFVLNDKETFFCQDNKWSLKQKGGEQGAKSEKE